MRSRGVMVTVVGGELSVRFSDTRPVLAFPAIDAAHDT